MTLGTPSQNATQYHRLLIKNRGIAVKVGGAGSDLFPPRVEALFSDVRLPYKVTV